MCVQQPTPIHSDDEQNEYYPKWAVLLIVMKTPSPTIPTSCTLQFLGLRNERPLHAHLFSR